MTIELLVIIGVEVALLKGVEEVEFIDELLSIEILEIDRLLSFWDGILSKFMSLLMR